MLLKFLVCMSANAVDPERTNFDEFNKTNQKLSSHVILFLID